MKDHGKRGKCGVLRCKGQKCIETQNVVVPAPTTPVVSHSYKNRFEDIYKVRKIFDRKYCLTKGIEYMNDDDWETVSSYQAMHLNFLKFKDSEIFLDSVYKKKALPQFFEIRDLDNLDHIFTLPPIYKYLHDNYEKVSSVRFTEDYFAIILKLQDGTYRTVTNVESLSEKARKNLREDLSNTPLNDFCGSDKFEILKAYHADPSKGFSVGIEMVIDRRMEDMDFEDLAHLALGRSLGEFEADLLGDEPEGDSFALIVETKEDPTTIFRL